MQISVKILNPKLGKDIPLPSYASLGAAGMDLRACIESPMQLKANQVELIPTGLAIHLADPNLAALILPRSGLGHKHGIVLGNGTGLIDSDYQGELKISCLNRSNEDFLINPGDRIAQLVIIPVHQVRLDLVDEFASSERGAGGFGHTGTN